jgi:hypothetical protein
MFVGVAQNVYGPNGIMPSAVRAYLVEEEIREFGAKAVDCRLLGVVFGGLSEPTFKFFDGLAHRKFNAAFDSVILKKNRKHPLDRLEPGIVQSAIKVVNSVSHHKGKISQVGRVCELMYKSFCSEFRVNLYPSGITFMKHEDACFDVVDMLIGPFDFQLGISEEIG